MNQEISLTLIYDSFDYRAFILDKNLNVLLWNEWLSIHTQISAEDIVGKNLEDFFSDIDYTTLKRKINTTTLLQSLTYYDSENSNALFPILRSNIVRSTDNLMKQEISIAPCMNAENQVSISIHDISELSDAKAHLKKDLDDITQLNKQLKEEKDIVDQNIMILKTTKDAIIIEASHLFCDFFNYQKDELINQKTSILKSGDLPTLRYKELWNTVLQKKVYSGELENITKSGVKIWINIRILPILDKDENIIEFHAVYHNIQDKKALEKLYVVSPEKPNNSLI